MDRKKTNELYFSSCNSANPDAQNTASAFNNIIDANEVTGWDGGTIYAYNDEEKLMLLISDHLDWTNEYEHLLQLQDKINAYISFLESEQYKEVYLEQQFSIYCIEIHFKYKLTANCLKFIDTINKQLSVNNIIIEVIVA